MCGGVVVVMGVAIKHWSHTQPTIALSSGEAELIAMTKGAGEGLGVVALLEDLGMKGEMEVLVDSSAAKSIASRVGVGRVRHLETKHLWIQEAVKDKKFTIKKIPGEKNPSDILTKPLSHEEMRWKLELVGAEVRQREGRRWADLED